MELYRRNRPESFADVVGQTRAVSMLKAKLDAHDLPHVVLLVGPTGTGKTSLARIIAKELGCKLDGRDPNLNEINLASERGLDVFRDIAGVYHSLPMGGKARVWVLEEAIQLPKATQKVSLDILEKCPGHVWFILTTTSTEDLLPTFLGRCFVVTLDALTDDQIRKIALKVLAKEEKGEVSQKVMNLLIEKSQGSGRKALQLLEAVLSTEDEQGQLELLGIASIKEEEHVEFLGKALMGEVSWRQVAAILDKTAEKDVIGLRCQVMAYLTVMLLRVPAKAALAAFAINLLNDNWQIGCHKAALSAACYKCVTRPR